jgi:tape measure domain-containing protein
MAKKDVELVIRAKNEASKAVDSVKDALKSLVDAQNTIGVSAGKTDTALTRLGIALTDLQKKFKGESGAAKIAGELDRAFQATSRLAGESRKAAAALDQLEKQAAEAATATAKLRTETEASGAAVKAQQQTVAASKQAQTELNQALRQSTAEREKLHRAETRTVEAIAKQEAAITRVAERLERYKTELAAAARPTQTLKSAVEAAGESLEKKKAKLTALNERLAETRTQAAATGGTINRLQGELSTAAATFEQQSTALARAAQSYKEMQAAVRTAALSQKQLKGAAEEAATALDRENAALNKAESEFQQLAVSATQADAAMAKLAAGSTATLQRSFDAQRRAMLETRREWQTAQGAVKDLAQQIAKTTEPNAALTAAFERARAAAAQAKAEYLAQRTGLNGMGQALRQTGTDVDTLRQQQERFAAAQNAVAAALARIRQDAASTGAAQRGLGAGASAAGAGLNAVGAGARAAGSGMGQASAQTYSFASALRALYGESRTAMSWTQRLRGEVLALTTSYVGLYAAVQGIGNVVSAFRTLEAAQSRLNVIAQGDKSVIAEELDFIRRTADRLGIQFGALADQYTKFAVSTKGTVLEGQKTKDVFISVAEAGRVNKLSLEQLQGIFTALSQIAGKSAVQMEELRQQLGDRLPGAVQLMADGLGVGVDVLIKMMEQGQVSSTALIGFADALDRRFGSSLPEALKSTSTELGKLENASFKALLTIGASTFIEKFTETIRELNKALSSADAEAFFKRVGVVLGGLMDLLSAAIRHFDLLVAAMMAVIGVKITPFILALGAQFSALYTNLAKTPAQLTGVATAARTSAASVGVLTTAMLGLRAAILALVSSTGIGLLITGISIAIGAWATQADKATEALNSHQKILDQVKNAYDKAGGAVKDWAAEIAKSSTTQAVANLAKLREELQDIRDDTDVPFFGGLGRVTLPVRREIEALLAGFKKGTISAIDFKARIDALAQANPAFKQAVAVSFLEAADNAAVAEVNIAKAEAVLAVLNGTASDTQMKLLGLGGSTDDAAGALARAQEAAKKFKASLDQIKAAIPGISVEMKRLKDLQEIDTLYNAAKLNAKTPEEVALLDRTRDEARAGINAEAAEKIAKAIVDKIVAVESGGRALAKNNVSTATGAGQFIEKTWLALFKQYFPERAAGMTEPMMLELRKDAALSKKLVEAYATENAKVLQDAGLAVSEAALYLAHFLGPNGAVKVLKKFAEDPNAPVKGLLSDKAIESNPTVLKGKSVGDVIGYATEKMGITDAQVAMVQEVVKLQDKSVDAQVKFNEEVRRGNEDRLFEAEQTRLTNAGLEKQAAINAAIREAEQKAIKDKVILEQADRQAIIDSTAALFDQTKAHELANEKVDKLIALRNELREQYELAQQTGDTAAEDATYQAILAINGQLALAIQQAIAMWEAIGGPAADAAIAKLRTMAVTTQTSGQQALIRWKEVGEYAAGGLANAFDSFAQKVVEGQSAFAAARDAFLQFASDFLRMIAQMIIQTVILNALKTAFPGTFGVAANHSGGIAGSSNRSRQVSPMWFANAVQYHNGGIAGLRPNEVPTILERGEEVLTSSDPRHRFNIGQAADNNNAAPAMTPKIVNAFDTASFLEAALNSKVGERAILNFVRANPGAFKQALG